MVREIEIVEDGKKEKKDERDEEMKKIYSRRHTSSDVLPPRAFGKVHLLLTPTPSSHAALAAQRASRAALLFFIDLDTFLPRWPRLL